MTASASAIREAMRDVGSHVLADVAAPRPSARVWSPMQRAIFEAVEQPGGHLVIEALAGTGKSTTIEEAVSRTSATTSAVVLAFNRSIADAMRDRVAGDVEVRTFHSIGGAIVRTAMGYREIDAHGDTLNAWTKELISPSWDAREARTACRKLVGLAKGCLVEGYEELDAAADAYGVEFPKGWPRAEIIRAALRIVSRSREATKGPITFDDMVWLPVACDLPCPTYDFVFVDETQDLNACQLELAKRLAADGGRIVAVGDRHQSIYGFRGADRAAMPRMIKELEARVLPLSVTYRCAREIVARANEFVPALTAAPGAPDGVVRDASLLECAEQAEPGDMIISRINAPLVRQAFRFMADGVPCRIQGRAIGEGLAKWIESTRATTVPALVTETQRWLAAECARLEAAERDPQEALDRAACIDALCAGRSSVAEVLGSCKRLFGDEGHGDQILLSSTHRAKGLEAGRVWLLWDTYLRRDTQEEKNLAYVGITRAKRELVYVHEDNDNAAP